MVGGGIMESEHDRMQNRLLARLVQCGFWWLHLHPWEYDLAMTSSSSHREFFFTFLGMAVIGYALDHRDAGEDLVIQRVVNEIESQPESVSDLYLSLKFGVDPRVIEWLRNAHEDMDMDLDTVVSSLRS